MADTWITNLTHFLDENGFIAPMPGPALRLAEYLTNIVADASTYDHEPTRHTVVHCRRRPGRKPCTGIIETGFTVDDDEILWECPACGDNGRISNWQGSPWDASAHNILPFSSEAVAEGSMASSPSQSVPGSVETVYQAIVARTDAICRSHLNEEYAVLARNAAEVLARKRPSPILRGRPEIWACGILYTLGSVNFLFDKSQTPHVSAMALCAAFGVSQSSASNKAAEISKILDTFQLDPRWCVPSLIPENPFVWMLELDGFVVDMRAMPRDAQVVAYQKGLIPYIPADRE